MPATIRESVAEALGGHERVLLAVSGGLDSSVLLDAAAATVPRDRLTVATFDHGTGEAATLAAAAVARRATELGVSCLTARSPLALRTEAELRDARWRFLRECAASLNARICTAHTADDQIETVLMRVLRGAGARGLAGLAARSAIIRPLLAYRRTELERYARESHVEWVEDPTNASLAYLRNRVRRELLPSLRRVRPGIDDELLAIGAAAAAWRAQVEDCIDSTLGVVTYRRTGWVDVPVGPLAGFEPDELRVLWPAVAARAGATLDRRALERLVGFTLQSRVGARAHVAGGWQAVRSREHVELRPLVIRQTEATRSAQPLSNGTMWGDYVFRAGEGDSGHVDPGVADVDDTWRAWLPADQPLHVRGWRAGDRLPADPGRRVKKVKELLTDAGVTGHQRAGWPVVLAGDQIVWIPGVSRSEAATARPGRPGLPFVCEYTSR